MSNYLNTTIICVNSAPNNYECTECNLDLDQDCECIWEVDRQTIDVYCVGCNETHKDISIYELIDTDVPDMEDEGDVLGQDLINKFVSYGLGAVQEADYVPQIRFTSKCRHYNCPVEMADGTVVYASSMHDRKAGDEAPDLGLYLDGGWRAAGMAYTVDWPDYNIPKKMDKAAYTIIDAYNKARKGFWVEVGCIGGHGRTGTALACMAVLGGMKPKKAVEHVRKTYCEHTLETDMQIWYVHWFDRFVNGGSIELHDWDKKLKATVLVHTYEYKTPFDWKNFDPFEVPTTPSDDIQGTVMDRYFTVPSPDPKKPGKYLYDYINEGDEGYEDALLAFAAQEEAAVKAKKEAKKDKGKATVAVSADDTEWEPF